MLQEHERETAAQRSQLERAVNEAAELRRALGAAAAVRREQDGVREEMAALIQQQKERLKVKGGVPRVLCYNIF